MTQFLPLLKSLACLVSAFAWVPISQAIDDPDYAKALSHLQTNELDQAMELVDTELKKAPESVPYLEIKGRILHRQGKYEEARERFDKALSLNPERYTIYFHLGETYFQQANWSEAFTNYRIHAESDPPAVNSRLKMIYCLSAVKNFPAALKLCSTLDPVDTYSPAYYFGRAALAHFQKKEEEYNQSLRQVQTIYGIDTFNIYMPDMLTLIKSTKGEKGGKEKKEEKSGGKEKEDNADTGVERKKNSQAQMLPNPDK